jgi:hypothetical protein
VQTERRHKRGYAKLGRNNHSTGSDFMSNEQQNQQKQQKQQDEDKAMAGNQQKAQPDNHPDFDALANKKPEELTPEELRLMADTMPGEGPGD